jgi:hypothetical protein
MRLLAASVFVALSSLGVAIASPIGDIQVFYNSTPNFGQGVLDGPVFVFQNATDAAIANGVLTIVGVDFFDVGTIAADSNVLVIPGLSNDGQNHGANNFFTHTGSIYDSSDLFSSLNTTQFEFMGSHAGTQIESSDLCGVIAAPVFTPACTAGPSNDGTVSNINFLGGPGNNDGPCNNCFGPQIVADLVTEPVGTPEPSTFILRGAALLLLAINCGARASGQRQIWLRGSCERRKFAAAELWKRGCCDHDRVVCGERR